MSNKSGLQLSRNTKGIQNTRRSVRGIGANGLNGSRRGSFGGGSSSDLGAELAKVDRKSERGERTRGGLGSGKKMPTFSADDLSIDDSVLSSEQQAARKKKTDSLMGTLSAHGGSSHRSSNKSSRKGRSSLNSRSEHGTRTSGIVSSEDDDLRSNKSDHNRSSSKKGLMRRSHTFNGKSTNTTEAKQHAVKGIHKLLKSMGESIEPAQPKYNSDDGGVEPAPRNRRAMRRSHTSDGSELPSGRQKSIQGIRNLMVDNKNNNEASIKDLNYKEKRKIIKDRMIKDRSTKSNDSSDSDESERKAPTRTEDFGTNHSRSLQGIHKLLGSMGGASGNNQDKEKEKAAERSQRRLQVYEKMATDNNMPEESPVTKLVNARQARKAAETPVLSMKEDEEDDDEDENDYDTVATPKTATGPPPALMKEAPPAPQRKQVARKPRTTPHLGPPQPKASNGSHKSAPAKVPSTPMKSPGGFVIELQNPTSTPGCTTPQAVTMPVMPNNDFDSVGTPKTIGDVAPPPVTHAPPPPPKRNMDMGTRWKNRGQTKTPMLGGHTTPNVCATPAAPRAPTMSMLSPGGIVIEVNSKKSGMKGPNRPPEPMTPMAQMTPMTSKSGTLSNTPRFEGLRNSMNRGPIVPQTPSMQSVSEHSDDISALTPGTFVGRTTPRQTPRQTPSSHGMHVPSTPSLYNSPGVISELTPGGYSVGLLGDDDYQASGDAHLMMTPRKFGILLEEDEDNEGLDQGAVPQTPIPSTPSLNSPAGVVSEMTPGTYGTPGGVQKRRQSIGAPPIPATPSVSENNESNCVSELTPGTSYGTRATIPMTTPSVQSPAGVVSELTPTSVPQAKMLSNLSNHSGVVSDITPGSFSTSAGTVIAG